MISIICGLEKQNKNKLIKKRCDLWLPEAGGYQSWVRGLEEGGQRHRLPGGRPLSARLVRRCAGPGTHSAACHTGKEKSAHADLLLSNSFSP